MSRVFVGVDPSLANTGVALLDEAGGLIAVGNTKFARDMPKKGSPNFAVTRLGAIAYEAVHCVLAHIQGWDTVSVAYEDYSFDSTHRAFTLGELGGVLKLGLVEAFGALALVAPTRLKKFATGSGRADKQAMLTRAMRESAAFARLAARQRTDDAADAFFLAKWAWYQGMPEAAIAHDSANELLRARLMLVRGKE